MRFRTIFLCVSIKCFFAFLAHFVIDALRFRNTASGAEPRRKLTFLPIFGLEMVVTIIDRRFSSMVISGCHIWNCVRKLQTALSISGGDSQKWYTTVTYKVSPCICTSSGDGKSYCGDRLEWCRICHRRGCVRRESSAHTNPMRCQLNFLVLRHSPFVKFHRFVC